MSAPSSVLSTAKAASDIKFPLFSPGQMLQHDDLTALADYTRMLMQLMLKSFFGCGVVCGLCVKAIFQCDKVDVTVDPGVAVDCCGNLIQVTKPVTISLDRQKDLGSSLKYRELWVVLRQFEKGSAPRAAACPSDDDEATNVCTREVCWYEVQVRGDLPDCACGCVQKATAEAAKQGARWELDENCYEKQESGECECECHCAGPCDCNCDCGGNWVVLAYVKLDEKKLESGTRADLQVDHTVRRYVRPTLAQNPACPRLRVLGEEPVPGEVLENAKNKPAGVKKPQPAAGKSGTKPAK